MLRRHLCPDTSGIFRGFSSDMSGNNRSFSDFFRTRKTSVLGNMSIHKLLLEYLTKMSVNIDIDKTSNNLENV